MKLSLIRVTHTDECTLGQLSIDGKFECYTLEDVERVGQPKVYGETAIPTGTYEVVITWSPRFKRNMPLLIDVRGFSGIRIHAGNYARDTEGCILVGSRLGDNYIYNSLAAYEALFAKLNNAIKRGEEIWLTISSPVVATETVPLTVPHKDVGTVAAKVVDETPTSITYEISNEGSG